jgi:hypothetical protein
MKNRGDVVHPGRDGPAGQSAGAVEPQRLSAQARKEKIKASKFNLDNTLNDFG